MQDPLDDPRYQAAREYLLPVWDQLGRVSDRVVGKLAGVPSSTVTRVRELARIPPPQAGRLRFEKHVAPLAAKWFALQDLPDMEIARRVGVRYSAVVLFRALKGLPPQAPPVDAWQAAAGLYEDDDIAHRARVGVARVAEVRASLGIARRMTPYWSGPPRWDDLATATEDDLQAALAAARALPEAPSIFATDPRFDAWFRAIGSSAPTVERALADYPDGPVVRRIYQLRALTERIAACNAMTLDEELRSLVASLYDPPRRRAMLERFGLHGARRRGAASIAAEFEITEETVWYWGLRFKAAAAARPWLPAFDRFLAAVDGGPRDDERLAALARAHGSVGPWPASAVEAAAKRLNRTVTFRRARMGTAAATLRNARHGPFTAGRARETLAREGFDLTTERVLALVEQLPGVEWVYGGPPDGWFWFPDGAERSVLVYAMRKLVAVGPVAASEVVEGVSWRNREGRERVEVPAEVAAAVAARLGLVVRGGVIDMPHDEDPLSRDLLTDPERAVVEAIERGPPILKSREVVAACAAAGLGPNALPTLWFSPVVREAWSGRFALRSQLRGHPPWTDLVALAGLAWAMGPKKVALGIRVAGGTWTWKLLGRDIHADMCALGEGAEALALVRPHRRRQGWSVFAERPGEVIECWAPYNGAMEVGPVVQSDKPLWLKRAAPAARRGGPDRRDR